MAIVLTCALSVDAYAAAGRNVEVPRPDCPDCAVPMAFWTGYPRVVRHDGSDHRIWVPRGRCEPCARTHALLPAFCVRNRLDSAETIGAGLVAVVAGPNGVRPAARALAVPHTTVRGWVRRFLGLAPRLAVAFAVLCVELGGRAPKPAVDPGRRALEALRAAWRAASRAPGWMTAGAWRFASSVCGGAFTAANMNSPYLIIGKRRFIPPVP